MNALALQFHQDMLDVIRRCKQEISYNPTYWSRMVAEQGGVGAARTLLQEPPSSDGFIRLWKEHRLEAHRFDVDAQLSKIINATGGRR